MDKTYYPRATDLEHNWLVTDASGQTLGRLAARVARVLLGKHKPNFTPGVANGDYVVVINAAKVVVTGKKLDRKMYYRHSMYPGGLRKTSLRDQLARRPEQVITSAVWGMLPKSKFGRELIKRLKVYAGSEHPHLAQKPEVLE